MTQIYHHSPKTGMHILLHRLIFILNEKTYITPTEQLIYLKFPAINIWPLQGQRFFSFVVVFINS
jgi:hypothetical protein